MLNLVGSCKGLKRAVLGHRLKKRLRRFQDSRMEAEKMAGLLEGSRHYLAGILRLETACQDSHHHWVLCSSLGSHLLLCFDNHCLSSQDILHRFHSRAQGIQMILLCSHLHLDSHLLDRLQKMDTNWCHLSASKSISAQVLS